MSPLLNPHLPSLNTDYPRDAGTAFNDHVIGHTVFAVGRFVTALLGYFIKPWRILLVLYVSTIVTASLATSLSGVRGTTMIILVLFFESGIFSLIFATPLRGLGAKTKWGAVLLTVGTSGGAFLPGITYLVSRSRGVQYAWVCVVAAFAFGAIMPFYIGLVPAARRQCDPGRVKIRRPSIGNAEMAAAAQARRNRRSKTFMSSLKRRSGFGGSEATSASTDRPSVEHVEQTANPEGNEKEGSGGGTATGAAGGATPSSQRHQDGGGMDLAPWPA